MNDEIIQDLKQFIAATVFQEVSGFRTDFDNLSTDVAELTNQVRGLGKQITEVKVDISKFDNKLSTRIDNLSQSVADAIENTNQAVHEQLVEHETRIRKLEQKTT